MKTFKRFSALIVACVIALSLASCGGNEESTTASKAESSSATSEATSESTSESTSEAASAETSEVASEATSEDISEATSEVTSETVSGDSSEESSEATSEDITSIDGKPVAKAVYGTPVVDATDIDKLWDSVPEYTGERIRFDADTNNPEIPIYDTYTRFTFKLMWDEEHFYVLEKVTDLSIGQFDPALTWQNDSTEISFSLVASNAIEYDLATDGWIGISPHEMTYVGVQATMFGDDLEYVDYAVDFDETGYVVCAAFDIASINSNVNWGLNHKIGFEISVNDSVNEGERANCIAWSDDTDVAFANPSVMGIVYLVQDANSKIPA